MDLTNDQLYTLRHMLGINTPCDPEPNPWRNYAAVNPGDPKYIELERVGAIKRYYPPTSTDYHWYLCTNAGKLAATQSHKKIRKSKGKRRYAAFLNISDVYPDLTFREFLTAPEFAEVRDNA